MSRLKTTAAILLALPSLLSLGCDGSSQPAAPATSPTLDVAKSALERDLSPEVPAADLAAVVAGDTDFAFDLYHELAPLDGNLIFSPHSISTALAMAYAGAEGDTKTEMADALGFTLPDAALHPAFNALDLALSSRGQGASGKDGEPFRLRVVNAAWAERDYDFLPSYLDTLGLNYGAGINLMDFIGQPDAARLTINAWVSEQTEARIPELLPEGSVSGATRLVLTNAVYFNAAWQHQFEPELTQDEPFTRLDGTEVQRPMMIQSEYLRYSQDDGVTALELPYDGGEVSMLLLTGDGDFESFEAGLDANALAAVDASLSAAEIEVHVPKFEYRQKASLKEALRSLGMRDAFEVGAADFSGMDGTRKLFISEVLHEAFILVDEEGTEAAAATAVVMDAGAAPPSGVVLRFDKPFIYLIRDVETGAILFVGRVLDPGL